MIDLFTEALRTLADRAGEHPVVAITALAAIGYAFVSQRRLLVAVPTSFLAIAALVGTEPVADPNARLVFAVGVFAAIACFLEAIRRKGKTR